MIELSSIWMTRRSGENIFGMFFISRFGVKVRNAAFPPRKLSLLNSVRNSSIALATRESRC